MRHRTRFVPIIAVAAFAASGCGSQSHTRSKLVAVADPVCQKVAEKREAANAALQTVAASSTKTLKVLARVAPIVASYEHNEVLLLSNLKAPASQAKDWQEMLTGMRELANDSTQLGIEAKAKKLGAVREIDLRGRIVQQRIGAIATRDGFTFCGRTS
jgi:hypothetical protein